MANLIGARLGNLHIGKRIDYAAPVLLHILIGFQCITMAYANAAPENMEKFELGAFLPTREEILAKLGPPPTAEDIAAQPRAFQIAVRSPVKNQGAVGSCVGHAASSVMEWWRCGLRCYSGTGDSSSCTCTCSKDTQGVCPCINPLFSRQYLYDRNRALNTYSCKTGSACFKNWCPHNWAECASGATTDCRQTVSGHQDCPCGGAFMDTAGQILAEGVCTGDCDRMQATYCYVYGSCDGYVYPVNSPAPYEGCSSGGTKQCGTVGTCGGIACGSKFKASDYFSANTVVSIKDAIYRHGFVLAGALICSCWQSSTRPWGSGCLGTACKSYMLDEMSPCALGCYVLGGHAFILYGWDDSKQGFRVQNSWGVGSASWPTGLGWISYSAVTNVDPTPSRALSGYYLTFDRPILGRAKRLTYNTADELACSISAEFPPWYYGTSWPPDGYRVAKIAFITEAYGTPNPGVTGELCVINRDGTGFRRLTTGGLASQPSISHDGTAVAFIWGIGNSSELYEIKTDGTGLKQITYNSVPESQPSMVWYDNVAFISGYGSAADVYYYWDFWHGTYQMTYNSVPDSEPCLTGFSDGIAFISGIGSAAELYYLDTYEGSMGFGPVRLTSNSVPESSPTINYWGSYRPWLKPSDSRSRVPFTGAPTRIVFKSGTGSAAELWAVNPDGSQRTRLTYNSVEEFYPRISEDANMVTFVVNNEVYVMSTWGGFLKRLTYNAAQELYTDTNFCGDVVACLTYAYTGPTRELIVFY